MHWNWRSSTHERSSSGQPELFLLLHLLLGQILIGCHEEGDVETSLDAARRNRGGGCGETRGIRWRIGGGIRGHGGSVAIRRYRPPSADTRAGAGCIRVDEGCGGLDTYSLLNVNIHSHSAATHKGTTSVLQGHSNHS